MEERRLDKWTHNKAIQKAIESCRLTDKQKVVRFYDPDGNLIEVGTPV